MSLNRLIKAYLILTLTFLFFGPRTALAKVVSAPQQTYTVGQGEVINDDLFIGAKNLEIFGTVNGDIFAGVESARINGTINGDLHIGGGKIDLSGVVKDDVYLGGGSITLENAEVGNSVIIGGGNVTIDSDTSVGGSLLVGAGNLTASPSVKRNVLIGGGSIDLNSVIGGEVRLGGGRITIGPDTKIAKDLYYTIGNGKNEATISNTATISGQIYQVASKMVQKDEVARVQSQLSRAFRAVNVAWRIISFIGALIVGYFCLRFFNQFFTKTAEVVRQSFLRSIGWGLATCLAIVPVFLFLIVSVVGIPLVSLLISILTISFYLTKIVMGLALGHWLVGKFNLNKISGFGSFTLGLTAIYFLESIPVFKLFVSIVVLFAGLGALVLYYIANLTAQKIK